MVILGVSEVLQMHATMGLGLGNSMPHRWGSEDFVTNGDEDICNPVIIGMNHVEPTFVAAE